MKCSCTPAGTPGGRPFADRDSYLLWLAGYPVNDFDTTEEAMEAAQAVLALEGMGDLSFTVEA